MKLNLKPMLARTVKFYVKPIPPKITVIIYVIGNSSAKITFALSSSKKNEMSFLIKHSSLEKNNVLQKANILFFFAEWSFKLLAFWKKQMNWVVSINSLVFTLA